MSRIIQCTYNSASPTPKTPFKILFPFLTQQTMLTFIQTPLPHTYLTTNPFDSAQSTLLLLMRLIRSREKEMLLLQHHYSFFFSWCFSGWSSSCAFWDWHLQGLWVFAEPAACSFLLPAAGRAANSLDFIWNVLCISWKCLEERQ